MAKSISQRLEEMEQTVRNTPGRRLQDFDLARLDDAERGKLQAIAGRIDATGGVAALTTDELLEFERLAEMALVK